MLTRFLVIIVLASSLFSCHSAGKKERPQLPAKKMQALLLDIHLAESYSVLTTDSLHKTGGKNTDSLAVYYKAIFARHHVTPEQFNQSMRWYENNPEDFDSVYNNMIAVAARWQANMLPSSPHPVPPPTPANKP